MPNAMRSFDPRRVGRLGCTAWVRRDAGDEAALADALAAYAALLAAVHRV